MSTIIVEISQHIARIELDFGIHEWYSLNQQFFFRCKFFLWNGFYIVLLLSLTFIHKFLFLVFASFCSVHWAHHMARLGQSPQHLLIISVLQITTPTINLKRLQNTLQYNSTDFYWLNHNNLMCSNSWHKQILCLILFLKLLNK